MTRFVGAAEAARQLGVQRATLYAYVSRGLVERRVAIDGRTSMYSVDDLEALRARGRRSPAPPRPSLDVQIATSVTTLDEAGPAYRGHDVADLARTATFEQVAELLWTGVLPAPVDWPPPTPVDVALVRRAAEPMADPLHRMIGAVGALAAHHPGDDGPALGRRLYGVLPELLADRDSVDAGDPRLPARLSAAWRPGAGPALASALKRALVVLADHELTSSTLAVRLAASVRTTPGDALVAGLSVIAGPLHGSASRAAHALLADCGRDGAAAVIGRRLAAGERLPGFGHRIYAADDPRLPPLRDAVALLPEGASAVLDEVVAEASRRDVPPPNVDLGLAALTFAAGLPADAPLFAVARIAGMLAHYAEELGEPPVRYRGIAHRPVPARTR